MQISQAPLKYASFSLILTLPPLVPRAPPRPPPARAGSPRREGQKRLYSPADRVRIKLILRGKRIGMTLQECVDFIDMYDPEHNNTGQLNSLINDVKLRRQQLLQQRKDIDDMLAGLDEVQGLCEASLTKTN